MVAAAVLPMTVAMTGWVAFWGVGIGVMRTFAPATLPKGEDQPAASVLPKAKVAVPHLSVVPDIVVPKPAKVVVPKVVKA
ncbi:hypothetical protein, partial [Enterobacter hormaechei]|uniref:hypothetical protein n=1 Tax=Enterobacter hormaechei TaxID=158836 RepID=UPI0013D30FC4